MKKVVSFRALFCIFIVFVISLIWQKDSDLKALESAPELNSQIMLGRFLFYDKNLSLNKTKSCSSCHDQKFAFTDGYRKSAGLFGDLVNHNSLPIFNLSSFDTFSWKLYPGNNLFQQILIPLLNTQPMEMGIAGNENVILNRIILDSVYIKNFNSIIQNKSNPFEFEDIVNSLSLFCLSIESSGSYFDNGKLSKSASKGKELFYSEKFGCANCHGKENFNKLTLPFLYSVNSTTGIRTPTLRNLVFTAPYFHDGSVDNLKEALEIHDQKILSTKNLKLMDTKEKMHLVDFLLSLTDSSLINNRNYADPFQQN